MGEINGSCGGSHTDSGDLACHCAAPPALRDWRSQYPTENDCLYAPQPRCAWETTGSGSSATSACACVEDGCAVFPICELERAAGQAVCIA